MPFSFIQRLRYTSNSPWLLFYTTSKHYHDSKNLISYTQPLQILRHNNYLKEIVEERYNFFNKNFHKYAQLTPRECQILRSIAHGNTNKLIAEELNIAFHTVKTHRKNICRKLETGKLIDLVKFTQVFLNE